MKRPAPTARSRWRAACIIGALGLLGMVIQSAIPAPTSQPASRPAASQPANEHRPVTLDLVQEYLKRWNVTNMTVDPRRQHVSFHLLVNRRTRLNCVVQIKMKRDDQSFDRLYVGVLELATVPASHPRIADVLKTLASLNWQNVVGTYSWDETDGEVRLEYALLANKGLCYADFADLLERLTLMADNDLPLIQRVIWSR